MLVSAGQVAAHDAALIVVRYIYKRLIEIVLADDDIAGEHKPEQRGERSYLIQQAFKVLAKHQRDLAQVMSLCYDVTPEEYLAECTPGQALQDFAELIVSEVWKTFFTPPGWSGISSPLFFPFTTWTLLDNIRQKKPESR